MIEPRAVVEPVTHVGPREQLHSFGERALVSASPDRRAHDLTIDAEIEIIAGSNSAVVNREYLRAISTTSRRRRSPVHTTGPADRWRLRATGVARGHGTP